jgi:hypothetical protein
MLLNSIKLKANYRPWPVGLVPALLAASAYGWMSEYTVQMVEVGISQAIEVNTSSLNRLVAEGERMGELAPRMAALYDLKLTAERALEAQEAQAAAKGASSSSAVTSAKVKVLDANIALLGSANQLLSAIAANKKEESEIRQRIKALRSAAPALLK